MLRGSRMELVEQIGLPAGESGHLPPRPPRRFAGYSRPPMSSAELTEWQAYEQVTGPLGPERNDILSAMLAFYIVSALGGKKAKLRLDKLMPRWDRRKAQPWEQMKMIAEALTRQHGGTVNPG